MKIYGYITLIMVVIISGSAYAEWSGTVADQPISYQAVPGDSLDVKTASFCTGNNGELYVVSAQGEPYSPYQRELYFTKSTDGGYTWSGTSGNVIINADDGQNVYQSANKKYTDIGVDSEGRIFIVWCEDYAETGIREVMLIYSTDGGNTWANNTADVPISNPTGAAYDVGNPSLAIDPDDNLHVVWHQKSDAVYNTYEILYSKSIDHGLTWTGQTADREISFRDTLTAWDPDIDCGSSGNIFVVWNEDASVGGEDQILMGISTDGGLTFSSETIDKAISAEYKETGAASIHIDNFDNIHVVYKGSLDVSPLTKLSLYTGSTDGGDSWSGYDTPVFIDYGPTGGIDSWNPAITSTSTGILVAVYGSENLATGNDDIWASYSYDGGATWSGNTDPDLVSLPDAITGSYVPYVEAGPGDTLHVVWREGLTTLSREDMYYSRGDTLVAGPTTGWISGIVSEAALRDPISGVHVVAEGTGIEADTDLDGEYILPDVPEGTYNVIFTHDSYIDSTIADVTVTPDDTTWLDVGLYPLSTAFEYLPGDVNMSGGTWPPAATGPDVTYLVNFFRGLPTSVACRFDGDLGLFWASADANGDCNIIGSDVTKLVNVFRGIGSIAFCADYETAWPSTGDLPELAPENWPNCE